MELQIWNVVLFGLKWVLIGLVYLMLSIVLLAVRRELSVRVATKPVETTFTPGRLKVIHPGKDAQKRVGSLLSLKPLTNLGTDLDNDIILTDTLISRHHARLRWDGAAWSIEDLESQNGTFVNQVRCQPYQAMLVVGGAILRMGEMSFELIE
jgi:pSer/pThr/pTyr-binding forkhead associated (FHA) protein